MRALLPDTHEDVDLHAWYAAGWIEEGGLRLDFVSSVDGAATTDGRSGGLQTSADNRVFAALRDLADIVVVGSATAHVENYRPIRLGAQRRSSRRDLGLLEYLPTAVISASLRVDPTAELFAASSPPARTIVITAGSGDPTTRATLADTCDIIVAGEREVDFASARAQLEQRGFARILAEGGPTMFGQWGAAGQVDELCLSITPRLAGPGARRIVTGTPWDGPLVQLELAGLLEEDGALFCRYQVRR